MRDADSQGILEDAGCKATEECFAYLKVFYTVYICPVI